MSTRLGDTSGTPSVIGHRVLRIIWNAPTMPPEERAGWYRELARMLTVAADKWDAYLAVEAARARQLELDNEPCPKCGGDRLRTDFTGSGRCHAARENGKKIS